MARIGGRRGLMPVLSEFSGYLQCGIVDDLKQSDLDYLGTVYVR